MTEAAVLNLGCGEDHHPDALNVDSVAACDPDDVHDLAEFPWPWDGVEQIRMYHVLEHLPDIERALREAADALAPGGELVVKLPMGRDATADPDHTWGTNGNPWTWRTPEFYCGRRHWDTDVGLRVAEKTVSLWSVHPSRLRRAVMQARWNRALRRHGPGEWCFGLPQSCGEFTIVFERP